jgi:hypothetical protein
VATAAGGSIPGADAPGSSNDCAVASTGEGVYAGGGSFEGTVKAFMPGRLGRLVAGDGLLKGFLLPTSSGENGLPMLFDCDGVLALLDLVELADRVDALLFLRLSFDLRVPKTDR